MDPILSVYDQLLKNPALLQNGEAILTQQLANPDFASKSLQILLDRQFECSLRMHIESGYLLKNVLITNWLNLANQLELQQILTTGIIVSHDEPTIMEIFSKMTTRLIQLGNFSIWVQPLQQFIGLLSQPGVRAQLITFFITLFQTNDSSLVVLCEPLLNAALKLFSEIDNYNERRSILVLYYYILGTVSYADQSDLELVKQSLNSTFQQWMFVLTSVLQSSAQEYLDVKIIVLKILVTLHKDLTNYLKLSQLDCNQYLISYFISNSELYYQTCILQPFQEETEYQHEISDLPSSAQELVALSLYHSLDVLTAITKKLLNTPGVLRGLHIAIFLNQREAIEFQTNPHMLTDQDDQDPTPRSLALVIMETLLTSKKQRTSTHATLKQVQVEFSNTWYGTEAEFAILENLDIPDISTQSRPVFTEIDEGRKLNYFTKCVQQSLKGFVELSPQLLESVCKYLHGAKSLGAALVGIKNLAALTVCNPNLQILRSLQLPSIIQRLTTIVDKDCLHILLDSSLQFLKVLKQDSGLEQLLIETIIKWQDMYANDTMICTIVNEIIEAATQFEVGWATLHQATGHFGGVLWLQAMRSLVKNAQNELQRQVISVKLPELLKWMSDRNNFDSDLMCQATILLKNFIDQFHQELVASPFAIPIRDIVIRLLTTYQEQTEEQATEQCGPLLLSFWIYFLGYQFDHQLYTLLVTKIVHQQSPSVIEALISVLCMMSQQYQQPLDVVSCSKIVRFHTVFHPGNHINLITRAIIWSISMVKDSVYFDPLLQQATESLELKLQQVLIFFYEMKGQQKLLDNTAPEDEDDWEDVEYDVLDDPGVTSISEAIGQGVNNPSTQTLIRQYFNSAQQQLTEQKFTKVQLETLTRKILATST